MHKKRKIDEENREFNQKWTFDYFFIKNHDKAFCLICNEVISVFKEFNLRRHYDTKHKIEFDQFKCQFRQNKVDSLKKSLEAQQNVFKKCKDQNSSLVKASLHISHLIAKHNKPFTDGEFIKKCILVAVDEICPEKKNFFENLSLSAHTIVRRIENISTNIFDKLKENSAQFEYFSLALDESNDITSTAQLLIFIRGIDKDFCVTEELAALKSLHGNTRGEDIFLQLSDVFNMNNLKWEKLVNVTTDGAKNMTGHNTGLVGMINKKLKELNIAQPPLQLHCIIHQHALCAKVVNLKNVMDIVVKSINYIRKNGLNHREFRNFLNKIDSEYEDIIYFSEIRWLSRGKVLKRFFELIEVIEIFLTEKGNNIPELTNFKWISELAFLVDITTYLNKLNIALQGKGKLINELFAEIKSFQLKIKLFISQLEKANYCHFPTLQSFLTKNNRQCPSNIFTDSLKVLEEDFHHRFQDFYAKEADIFLFENPLKFDFAKAPENLQLELIDLQSNNVYKNNFNENSLTSFYSYLPEKQFPNLKNFAKSIICIFSSTYLCEQTFSKMNFIKSKHRTRLTDDNLQNLLRISASQAQPDFNVISNKI